MNEADKDMILMLHEFEYELNGQNIFSKQPGCKRRKCFEDCDGKNCGSAAGNCSQTDLENKMAITRDYIFLSSLKFMNRYLKELALEGIRFHEEVN